MTARVLGLDDGRLALQVGEKALAGTVQVSAEAWTAIAATFDGARARLYVNGKEVASKELEIGATEPVLGIAPMPHDPPGHHFGGRLAKLQLHSQALSAQEIDALAHSRPDFDVMVFHEVGGHWPWQVRQWRGLQEPQDPWTACGCRRAHPIRNDRLVDRPVASRRSPHGFRQRGADLPA
jgi:hypothetical protein